LVLSRIPPADRTIICGAKSEPHQNAPYQEAREDLPPPNTTAAYGNEADAATNRPQ
jgi:hypothetical protein